MVSKYHPNIDFVFLFIYNLCFINLNILLILLQQNIENMDF